MRSIYLLLGAIVIAGLLVLYFSPANTTGETFAAWVQAIGSIGAIVGAILVGKEQARTTLDSVTRAHEVERDGRVRSILAVAEAAAERAKRIADALSDPNIADPRMTLFFIYDKSIVDGMVRALSAAPAHELGSRDGVIALLALRDQYVFLGEIIARLLENPADSHKEALAGCGDDMELRRKVIQDGQRVLTQNVVDRVNYIRGEFAKLETAVKESQVRI